MTIPDKGSHYLKKSPSPTGSKLPPGESTALSPVETEDGSPAKKIQQVRADLLSFMSGEVCGKHLIEKKIRRGELI